MKINNIIKYDYYKLYVKIYYYYFISKIDKDWKDFLMIIKLN